MCQRLKTRLSGSEGLVGDQEARLEWVGDEAGVRLVQGKDQAQARLVQEQAATPWSLVYCKASGWFLAGWRYYSD